MKITLGDYKVTWTYDPMKNTSYCVITDKEDTLIVMAKAKRHYKDMYDKGKVRSVTFKKALKKALDKHLISKLDTEKLNERFLNLPNKGVL